MPSNSTFHADFRQALLAEKDFIDQELITEELQTRRYEGRLDDRGKWNKKVTASASTSVRYKAIVHLRGGRTAMLSAHASSMPDPASLAKELMKKAKKAKSAPGAGLPLMLETPAMGLEILDPRQATLTEEDRQGVISWNIESIANISQKFRPDFIVLEESVSSRVYTAGKRMPKEETSSRFSLRGRVRKTGTKQFIDTEIRSRHFADVASRPLCAVLVKRLEAGDKPVEVPEKADFVIFEPRVVGPIIQAMLPAFEAGRIERGESFISGQLGKERFSNRVHIIDDASLPNGVETRAFDDRGGPPMALTLVREGVMDCTYILPETAKQRDCRPTGHAGQDALWPGNILVKAGRRSLNMILTEDDTSIQATHIKGPLQLDIKTGEIEFVAHCFLNARGRTGKAGDCRFKGNIFDILSKVVETANDQKRVGSTDVSSWVLEGLEFELA